ncbi:FtsX-like permease family protein [Kribbella sandramycini]|uniref:FtsX-like permease family protein n=1 Tax=Kribbella sandramycini TaxID=60450 RepID=A0A7Y4KY40_9ACTN|nr:FtsX-like permease family protein [Kribbella sandramycini]MBB6569354.1 putative ABC transport system permease protein [Kribbella sandramycini]NOL40807.1 FtsX-like permease family protein [Kribbella sandramycini]
MFQLSRQTVSRHKALYVGSFVALAFGVFMLGLAATATAATIAYRGPLGAVVKVTTLGGQDTPPQRVSIRTGAEDVSGLQTVLSMVGSICGFITIFVIASTFAFAVASRRRELGLLRLIGATPQQIRRMILGEALVVAVVAALTGAFFAHLATPLLLAKASYSELAPVKLEPASPWLPLSIAMAVGLMVALLGAHAAARRAGRIAPIDALREAALEPPRIGPVRVVFGVLFLVGSIALLALIRPSSGEAAMPLAMFTPMLLVIGLTLIAPIVVPVLGRLWAAPLVAWTHVSGRLARSNIVAAPRRSASLAAPILTISAIAGSMVLSLSFAADSEAASLRDTMIAPIVVPGGSAERVAATPGVAVVDAGLPVQFVRISTDYAELESAEGIDPAVATRTRDLTPSKGDLSRLTGNTVAVSKEMAGFERYRVGSKIPVTFLDKTEVKLTVVAIVPDAFGLNPSFLVPADLARKHAPAAQPERLFVLPAAGVDAAELTGRIDGAVSARAWEAAQADGLRKGNEFGLILLLGPAALYSAIAIANTLLMGSLQRRQEFTTSRLLGATPSQLRRMVLWESALVGATALSQGAAITVTVGALVRYAMTAGLSDVPITIPWGVLLGIGGVCLTLAVGSALAPASYILRVVNRETAVHQGQ